MGKFGQKWYPKIAKLQESGDDYGVGHLCCTLGRPRSKVSVTG